MVGKDETNTRKKILLFATKLFAEKGYSGTSVREIAKGANVNLAAINYHFGAKKSLLLEALKFGHEKLCSEIQELPMSKVEGPTSFCLLVFTKLIENGHTILNNMKLIMSVECQNFEGVDDYGLDKGKYGPPGGEQFISLLKTSQKKDLSDEDALWLVQTIFSLIFHYAIVLSTPYSKKKKIQRIFDESKARTHLTRTCETLIHSLDKISE